MSGRSLGIISLILAAVLIAPMDATCGILDDPNLISISFYESTSGVQTFTFLKTDARLVTDVNQNPPTFASDFVGTPLEYYDVYVSDAVGSLDPSGDYITIECYFNSAVGGVGGNIDAVSLNLNDGSRVWMQTVTSFVTGDGSEPGLDGRVGNALYASDNSCTYMGYHYSRMTLGTVRPSPNCLGFNGSFCDDFDAGIKSEWTLNGTCKWQVVNGALHTSLSGYAVGCDLAVLNSDWRDYTFGFDVRGNSGNDKGAFFRVQSGWSAHYGLNFRSDWNGKDELILLRSEVIVQTVQYPSQNGTWYHLEITCIGSLIEVRIDGNLAMSFMDPTPIPSGGIGVGAWTGAGGVCDIDFDNVQVTGIGAPRIALNPASLSFDGVQNGPLPPPQIFTITNTGGGTLDWSVASDQSWLVVTQPSAGQGNNQAVEVSVTTTALPVGTHTATLTVTSANADNSPQTVEIAYTIQQRPVPVVLVHGWNSSSATWSEFRPWLEADGLPYVRAVDLNPCGVKGEKDFDKNAEILSNFIESNLAEISSQLGYPVNEVDIVAHSMGGLVARRYSSPGSYENSWSMLRKGRVVRHLIMLGTPNSGVNLATLTQKWFTKFGKVGGAIADAITAVKAHCIGPAKKELASSSIILFNSRYEDNVISDYRVVAGTFYSDCLGDQIKSGGGLGEGCPTDGVVGELSVYRGMLYWPILSNTPVIRRFVGESRPLKHSGLLHDRPLADAVAATLKAPDPSAFPARADWLFAKRQRGADDSSFAGISGSFLVPALVGGVVSDTVAIPHTSGVTFTCYSYGAQVRFLARSPSGALFDSSSTLPDSSVVFASDSDYASLYIQAPEVGDWQIQVENDSLPAPVWTLLLAWNWEDGIGMVGSVSPTIARLSDTLRIFARLDQGGTPVLGASVHGTVLSDSSDTHINVVLHDDGIYPDDVSSDGRYSAAVPPFLADSDHVVIEVLASGVGPSGQSFTKELNLGAYVGEGHAPCGDVDMKPGIDVFDVIYLIDYAFSGGPAPSPERAGDVDGSGVIDVFDVVYLIDYTFSGGAEPKCQ